MLQGILGSEDQLCEALNINFFNNKGTEEQIETMKDYVQRQVSLELVIQQFFLFNMSSI